MKKTLSLFLALTLCLPPAAVPRPAAAAGWAKASGWAEPELAQASAQGLIPGSLNGQDLTKPITRAEFAAVAVKVYENLSGKTAAPSPAGTFADTKDEDVLKAHGAGLMVGVSATEFGPDTPLNREQAATALTRVLKAAYIPGWSFADDGRIALKFAKPEPFADDAGISSWAGESVYFMTAAKILQGVGDDKFAPKNASTREAAVIIGLRLVENLKGKPLDRDACTCCPGCDPKECGCEECADGAVCKCPGGGLAGGPYTFKVEIEANHVGGLGQHYRTNGTATVTLKDYDASGWFGSAEGVGEYSDWGEKGVTLVELDTGYTFTVRLSGFNPLNPEGITVGIDRLCAEEETWVFSDGTSGEITGAFVLYFEFYCDDIYDEDTGLYCFKLSMENGTASLTEHWVEPPPGLIVIDITITVTPLDK